jgi:hypothetical protein
MIDVTLLGTGSAIADPGNDLHRVTITPVG